MSVSPLPTAEVLGDSPSSPPLSPAPAETFKEQAPSPILDAEPLPDPLPLLAPRTSLTTKPTSNSKASATGTGRVKARTKSNGTIAAMDLPIQPAMGITESIASAPAPRPAEFAYDPDVAQFEIDVTEALSKASKDALMPGSPTSKVMRAMAPPGASIADSEWPTPPPNASVNLFIGRALLANGNDNWPLKPNDIVNWIRKHYPGEWDGDEGRCSAHRVRTYLARKGADMYYEKLAQSSISGWRIRQSHLWRFENGGFQGRGMKQEEALLEKAKETEAAVTNRHKAAAAEALAAGHPGVKTSMSLPGMADGSPVPKKARVSRAAGAGGSSLGPKRKSVKKGDVEHILAGLQQQAEAQALLQQQHLLQQQQEAEQHAQEPLEPYYPTNYQTSGPSHQHMSHDSESHDPLLSATSASGVDTGVESHDDIDMNMVHQAMQAAAGHIDDLDMGIQLPIEMQMHGDGEHDDRSAGQYYGETFSAAQGYGMGLGTGGAGQGYWGEGSYGYQQGQ